VNCTEFAVQPLLYVWPFILETKPVISLQCSTEVLPTCTCGVTVTSRQHTVSLNLIILTL